MNADQQERIRKFCAQCLYVYFQDSDAFQRAFKIDPGETALCYCVAGDLVMHVVSLYDLINALSLL